jgi:YHS domain-containing protein
MASYFDAARPAVYDAALRTRVNYEFYVFADAEEKHRFDADPLRWCGTVTDPIDRQRFRPTKDSPRATHAGVPYFFRYEQNEKQFVAAPDSFAVMQGWMFSMPMRGATPPPPPASPDSSAAGGTHGSHH